MSDPTDIPEFAKTSINLCSPRLGAQGLFATDQFFAPLERLLKDEPAIFIADKYDDHGKWMDGWESRRRRDGGHDHAVIKLGVKGIIKGVDIDTSHFTGNHPPSASIEACLCDDALDAATEWDEIVGETKLGPDAHHFIAIDDLRPFNYLRLNIFPDGGVARLRAYGEPVAHWFDGDRSGVYELSALKNGGRIIAYNNAHYGTVWTLLTDGRGVNMGDGWETRRRREPGNDWMIIALGAAGAISSIEVDTCHFKGNYPDRCSVQGAMADGLSKEALIVQSADWNELLAPQKLKPDAIHTFSSDDLAGRGPVSHVRLNIFPDGGVSRFRVFGELA